MAAVRKFGLSLLLPGVLCVLYGLGGVGAAHAQTPAALQTMIVSLMPQYDDPRLLIVFDVEMDQPGQGYIAIPDAVELHSAEARLDDGSYQAIEAKFEGASDGRFITFTSPTRTARVSFYQDVITREAAHVLDFTLPAQRDALSLLAWRVVFPLGATDIAMDPEMLNTGDVHYGMPGYLRETGGLPARTPAVQQVRWTRASSSPSIAREVTTDTTTETNAAVSEGVPTPTVSSPSANVGTDILAETTGRIVRGETDITQAREAAKTQSDWFSTFRANPIVWGAVAVFIVGLLLVLDGIRKRVTRKPL